MHRRVILVLAFIVGLSAIAYGCCGVEGPEPERPELAETQWQVFTWVQFSDRQNHPSTDQPRPLSSSPPDYRVQRFANTRLCDSFSWEEVEANRSVGQAGGCVDLEFGPDGARNAFSQLFPDWSVEETADWLLHYHFKRLDSNHWIAFQAYAQDESCGSDQTVAVTVFIWRRLSGPDASKPHLPGPVRIDCLDSG